MFIVSIYICRDCLAKIKTYISTNNFETVLVDVRKAYKIFLKSIDKTKLRRLCDSENDHACIQEVHITLLCVGYQQVQQAIVFINYTLLDWV